MSIDRAHGLIRKWTATHAAAHDGARLEDVLDRANTASEVYADTAYRSAKNEAMLLRRGFVSRIHRKKPKDKAMPERTRFANTQKSKVRSAVEHVFAHQKGLGFLNLVADGESEETTVINRRGERLVRLRGKYADARPGGQRPQRAELPAEIDLDIPKAREQIEDSTCALHPLAKNPVIGSVQLCCES
jgi:IS5 family transposase